MWPNKNLSICLIDLGFINVCIHLLVEYNFYLSIIINWIYITAAVVWLIILNKFVCFLIHVFLKYVYSLSFIFIIFLWKILILNFVIWSLNYKIFISSWYNWVWSFNKNQIVSKNFFVLLQLMKHSCIWYLKNICSNLKIYWNALIQNFGDRVLWNWRTAWIQSLDESVADIKRRKIRCWLIYEEQRYS